MNFEMPISDFFGHKISGLMMGINPFSGNSHVSHQMDSEMDDYYTGENIKKAVTHAMDCGINTIQVRTDRHILRLLREFRNECRMPMRAAQYAPELLSFKSNINQCIAYNPIAIYQHGSSFDALFKDSK